MNRPSQGFGVPRKNPEVKKALPLKEIPLSKRKGHFIFTNHPRGLAERGCRLFFHRIRRGSQH